MPSCLQRLASSLVCGYVRRCPLDKGKWRLLRLASSFLVAEPEPGTFVRVRDLANPVELALVRRGLLEPEDVRLFLSLLRSGMTVFDVGANVGMYTLLAARRVGAAGAVHAFEPTPHVAASLRANVALNRLANVVVNEAAVSDTAGVATLYLQAGSDRNTLADRGGTPTPVRTLTLDDYVAARGLGRVDVMKMDVEGAEVMALGGASQLLSAEDAPVLLLEINPEALEAACSSAAELRGLLAAHGYDCHSLGAYGAGRYCNALAFKAWHRDQFPALRCLNPKGPPVSSSKRPARRGGRFVTEGA
jgi:FkbM family methyltransferase